MAADCKVTENEVKWFRPKARLRTNQSIGRTSANALDVVVTIVDEMTSNRTHGWSIV